MTAFYPHFTSEESECSERFNNFAKVTQIRTHPFFSNSKAGDLMLVCFTASIHTDKEVHNIRHTLHLQMFLNGFELYG